MLISNSSISNTNTIDGRLNSYINNLNINELTKEQLISLIKYINSICKETLPVKCILLLLKTVLKNIDCELVEFCQLDDNNLVVNYMLKDVFMLHKNVINHSSVDTLNHLNHTNNSSHELKREDSATNSTSGTSNTGTGSSTGTKDNLNNVDSKDNNGNKDNNGTSSNADISENNIYYYVFSTNSNNILVIDDIEEYNNSNMYKYHNNLNDSNNTPNFTPSNMILIPMLNSSNNVWSVLSIINYKFKLSHVETLDVDDDLGNSLARLHLADLNDSVGNGELRYIYELCFISGIIINNVIEKLELESNKNKSNSLITLMHSLFSDQLSIQSCLISLTTHAKKLIQVENCTVYLFNKSKNQLLSISSNTCVQSILTLSTHSSVDTNISNTMASTGVISTNNGNFTGGKSNTNNVDNCTENKSIDVLTYCVNTSNTIIYDSNYNNNSNMNNLSTGNCDNMDRKNNVVVINSLSHLPFLSGGVNSTTLGSSSRNGNTNYTIATGTSSSKTSGTNGYNTNNNHNKNGLDRENSLSNTSSVELSNGTSEMSNIRNGIWIPIKNDNNVVLAVIEVINKQAQELLHFTEDDLNLLELFAVIVGPQFERSEFNNIHLSKNITEAGLAFDNNYLNNNNLTNNNIKNFIEQSIIEEEEDDNIE